MQPKDPKTEQRVTAYSWLLPPVAVVMAGVIGWPVFWYVKSRQIAAASKVADARALHVFRPALDNLRTLFLCCRWVAIYDIVMSALACARV
jgi:cbb3-type cytochrome oxidase maturation protein